MANILTVEQAAEKLQMSTKVVREYLRTGKMPGRKVGRAWRVLETDLEQWVSTGQEEHARERVSALGLLKGREGRLSSEDVVREKQAEAEIEEEKFSRLRETRKSA